jgi:hypothetical protein
VIRRPAIGAQLQTVDEASIKDVPGVVRVVREGDFLGVVAETEWTAISAFRQDAPTREPPSDLSRSTARACKLRAVPRLAALYRASGLIL